MDRFWLVSRTDLHLKRRLDLRNFVFKIQVCFMSWLKHRRPRCVQLPCKLFRDVISQHERGTLNISVRLDVLMCVHILSHSSNRKSIHIRENIDLCVSRFAIWSKWKSGHTRVNLDGQKCLELRLWNWIEVSRQRPSYLSMNRCYICVPFFKHRFLLTMIILDFINLAG